MDLEKYRRVARLTKTQLAAESGVDLAIISRLESGHRAGARVAKPSYDTIVKLARALNLKPEELEPIDFVPPPDPADGAADRS